MCSWLSSSVTSKTLGVFVSLFWMPYSAIIGWLGRWLANHIQKISRCSMCRMQRLLSDFFPVTTAWCSLFWFSIDRCLCIFFSFLLMICRCFDIAWSIVSSCSCCISDICFRVLSYWRTATFFGLILNFLCVISAIIIVTFIPSIYSHAILKERSLPVMMRISFISHHYDIYINIDN